MASPLEQFEIIALHPIQLAGYDISFTNSSKWMVIAAVFVTLFMALGSRGNNGVPTRLQSMAESIYEFIANMVSDNIGEGGKKFFPFVFTLFNFILFINLLGLIPVPGGFTPTSQIIVTFTLAMVVFILITLVGIFIHGFHFLSYFVPAGVPKFLIVPMFFIEIISYLSRPLSLAIRLFANMMAGHTMLAIFAGFIFSLGAVTFGVGGLVPFSIDVILIGFEVLVAFLQAYVFCVLTCLYLHDAVHLH